MCLAIPGKVTEITDNDLLTRCGCVSFDGLTKNICLSLVPEAEPGDYVIVHAGYAISVLDEEEAAKVFETLKEADEVSG